MKSTTIGFSGSLTTANLVTEFLASTSLLRQDLQDENAEANVPANLLRPPGHVKLMAKMNILIFTMICKPEGTPVDRSAWNLANVDESHLSKVIHAGVFDNLPRIDTPLLPEPSDRLRRPVPTTHIEHYLSVMMLLLLSSIFLLSSQSTGVQALLDSSIQKQMRILQDEEHFPRCASSDFHTLLATISKPECVDEFCGVLQLMKKMVLERARQPPAPAFPYQTGATAKQVDVVERLLGRVEAQLHAISDHHRLVSDVFEVLVKTITAIHVDDLTETLKGCPAPTALQPFAFVDNLPGLWRHGAFFRFCVLRSPRRLQRLSGRRRARVCANGGGCAWDVAQVFGDDQVLPASGRQRRAHIVCCRRV